MKYAHETPPGKPHFRYVGFTDGGIEIYFLQKGFNVKFNPQFGSDKPDPDGYDVLFTKFDEVREYSKQSNPDYETSTGDKLTILQSAILERLACPITKGMRIAYEDMLELIGEVQS